jgi:predicted AAA+ superfamily ATPase
VGANALAGGGAFDLLDARLYHELLADPGAFGDALRRLKPGSTVVVDEVQRLPGLLNEIHRAIEERRLRYAILGSSARKLSDLDILEDTLVAVRLRAFEGRLRVREKRHPKIYWIDPGLARAVTNQVGPLAAEERGALFEGWVLSLLRAYGEIHPLFDDVRYWATPNVEVEFLLERGGRFLAIEAKASARVGPGDFGGLRAIGDLRGITRRVLVHPGTLERVTEEGIEIWPVATLVERLEANDLWPRG